MPQLLRYTVIGRVQGVYFREGAKAEAKKLGLGGYVRNDTDGAVRGEAVGESSSIEAFTEWLRKGPERATVKDVQTSVEEVMDDQYQGVFEKVKNRRP
ncbi:hypothetical protein FRB94_005656 [Tulasnella sp. JGI-2019a]|nr:hypothetical protein FRB94_005656 [Tulasnella sp. JGI-2019a]KAG9007248.1 hypothetical protein FRB93_008071 [Tulasnella sp. JGI-2019a]KAG9033555.1 hypothetical protein FRB95_014633 [Tulasnella sp. JGI-2019a]